MQNLFISPDDEFIVKISVAIDKVGTIFCDLGRKSLTDYLESVDRSVDDFTIEDYSATFKKPSFGDSVELYDSIFSLTNGVDVNFNPIMVRYNKIAALIKSWDLQETEGKPSEDDIRKLHPTIATVIGIQVDQETGGIFG